MKYIEQKSQKIRISFFLTLFLFIFSAIIFRLFEIQVLRNGYYLDLAESQHWVTRKIPAERGNIYTKDLKTGEKYILATNKNLNMVYAIPQQIKDKGSVASELASILDMEKDEIFGSINNDKLYVPIKHKLSDEEVEKIENSSLGGVLLVPEQWREYPESSLASHIVGFVNAEGDGQYGVEGYYNDRLKGTEGQISLERDTVGRPIAIGDRIEDPAEDGQDIVLTIDRIIQSYAEKELKEAVEKFDARSGNVIVMDPSNGDIWAMTNYPDFDPNEYNKIEDYDIFKNTSISHIYEPGSIFKIITMAAGIDAGAVLPTSTFVDSGAVKIGGYTIRNSDGKAHGAQTMTQVLEESLNTGAYYVKEQMGNEVFYKYIERFGFGKLTGIDLGGEVESPLKSFESYRDINFATMTFGQGIAVTPMQFITASSVIANGGDLIRPNIVSEFIMPDGSKIKPEARLGERVIKKETANMIGAMMVSVVENGHGKTAQIDGYRIAGKTGTAEIPAKDGSGYLSGKNIGSFILFAPAEDPRFIILVEIDEPKGVQWAESTAAPVAGRLAEKILNYLEIPPSTE